MNSIISTGQVSFMAFQTFILALIPAILRAGVIFLAGWWAIKFALKLSEKFLKKTKIDPILHSFILTVIKILLLTLLAISSLDALGVPTTSLITSLGAVGLAVSLAVKDSLTSLAGGVTVLLVKPFKLGDFVEIDGLGGSVSEIGIAHTIINTSDNKRIYIPNSDVAKAKIINYSSEEKRRLDTTFSIGYQNDFNEAISLIKKAIDLSGMAIDDPSPIVRVIEHNASSIDITCRVWVKNADYFNMLYYLKETTKTLFDQNGIEIPFNQLDVHIKEK